MTDPLYLILEAITLHRDGILSDEELAIVMEREAETESVANVASG